MASGEDRMDTMIERFCVGAMDVEGALRVFRRIPRKAVVTGGMRPDIQHAALETDTRCLILTGGVTPNEGVRHRARMLGVPVLVVQGDTMATVERFEQLLGRVRIRVITSYSIHYTKLYDFSPDNAMPEGEFPATTRADMMPDVALTT